MSDFKLDDQVKVVRLLKENREFAGTMDVLRAPTVDDVGKVVFLYPAGHPAQVAVESFDDEGRTIWLADFLRFELELVSRPTD